MGKNNKAVATTQIIVLSIMIRFLDPTLSAIAPRRGENKATTIADIEMAQDQYCVPNISLSAMDFVK